jgi:hypothetical protein
VLFGNFLFAPCLLFRGHPRSPGKLAIQRPLELKIKHDASDSSSGATDVVGSFLVELVNGGIMIGFAPFHEAVIQGLCSFLVAMAFDCLTPQRVSVYCSEYEEMVASVPARLQHVLWFLIAPILSRRYSGSNGDAVQPGRIARGIGISDHDPVCSGIQLYWNHDGHR